MLRPSTQESRTSRVTDKWKLDMPLKKKKRNKKDEVSLIKGKEHAQKGGAFILGLVSPSFCF